MKLYKQVMAKYLPERRVTDGLNLYGVATAEAFVQLLYRAGKNPTRASLMKAYRSWNQPNQFLLPGNRQKTSGSDQLPLQCERIIKFTERDVPARLEAQVRHGEGDVARRRRSRARIENDRERAGVDPSLFPGGAIRCQVAPGARLGTYS